MKSLLILLFTVTISSFTMAQSMLDEIGQHVCSCLDKSDDTYDNQNTLQLRMQECAMSADQSKLIALFAEMGITDPTDPSQTIKMSQGLQTNLVEKCPNFKAGMKKLQMSMMSETATTNSATTVSTGQTMKGILIERFFDSVSSFYFRTEGGELEKIFWLSDFNGSEQLLKQPNLYIEKEVEVNYKEIKIYDPSIFGYKTVKQITGLRLVSAEE